MVADSGHLVERRKGRKPEDEGAGSGSGSGSGLLPSTSQTQTRTTRSSAPCKTPFSSFLSSQTMLVLCVGILTGYVVLPMVLVEINMDQYMNSPSSQEKSPSSSISSSLRALAPSDVQQRLVEDQMVLSRQSLPTSTSPLIMPTHTLSDHKRKKILVTGGAGFVGSHLVDKLMMEGHEVIVMDNFFTGQKKNIAHWFHHPNFR
jgi:hypothetical protein